MKITQVELEDIISEEIVNTIEEGPFSRLFNKGLQKLKTRNVAKQDKEMGIQRTSQGPEKEKPADKFMDKTTKKNVVRIAAEILSDIGNIDITKTKHLKNIDVEHDYGTRRARGKIDFFEETLEEADPKKIKFYSGVIETAIRKGKVTLEGMLDDIISLSKTNPIVKAMVGVEELVAQFDKAEEPAEPEAGQSAEPEAGQPQASKPAQISFLPPVEDDPQAQPSTPGEEVKDSDVVDSKADDIKEPEKVFRTPDSSQRYKITDLISGNPYREYVPIGKESGFTEKQSKQLIDRLVSMNILYKLGTTSDPTKDPLKGATRVPATSQQQSMGKKFFEQEEKKVVSSAIWQQKLSTQNIKSITETPQFINFAKNLTTSGGSGQLITVADLEKVKKFLSLILQKGKLGFPKSLTGPEDPSKSELKKPSGTSAYTPGKTDIRRESKEIDRWKKLAGILKD